MQADSRVRVQMTYGPRRPRPCGHLPCRLGDHLGPHSPLHAIVDLRKRVFVAVVVPLQHSGNA